jgi:hypothetical protein
MLLLVFWIPILFRWSYVIERFGRFRFIRTRRVHGGEGARARVWRRFFDRGAHTRQNADDVVVLDKLDQALNCILGVRNETRLGRMIVRDRLHHIHGRF